MRYDTVQYTTIRYTTLQYLEVVGIEAYRERSLVENEVSHSNFSGIGIDLGRLGVGH